MCYAKGLDSNEITLKSSTELYKNAFVDAINLYIELQLAKSEGNQYKKKGQIVDITRIRDWTHLLRFKKEIERESD